LTILLLLNKNQEKALPILLTIPLLLILKIKYSFDHIVDNAIAA